MINVLSRIGWWLLLKGGESDMYALFIANRVSNGKLDYAKVPAGLKQEVDTILKEEGAAHLIGEAK